MKEAEVEAYVRAAASAVGLALDADRVRAVAFNLNRTLAMARKLDGFELSPVDEPSEIYRPAPFPT